MKKLAIFAEGGTEQAFAEKLLIELAGAKNIQIRKDKVRGGGGNRQRQIARREYSGAKDAHNYYAVIVDCGSDNRVTSDIRDNYKTLCSQQFDCVVGIRDVRGSESDGTPITLSDVPRIHRLMRYGVARRPIDPVLVLAVMEIEAWFLAEYTHFSRVDAALTLSAIIAILGFDPSTGNVETRPTPAEDIDLVYRSVGKQYTKEAASTQRTIDAIDYDRVFCELPDRVAEIKPLVTALDAFFA